MIIARKTRFGGRKKLNKLDKILLFLAVITVFFVLWCAWEFHRTGTEPTALIAMWGAIISFELTQCAKIKTNNDKNASGDATVG